MKKILTVALSTAMAFSMFASVAFGDSATAVSPQEKFDALAAKGIFNGFPDKQAHLEKDMTRAEFAKVLTKLLGLKEVTGTLSYKDKGYDAKNWAVPYIEAVTAAGIMEGQDTVKKIFNYNGQVTVQEMATVLTRALKLEVPTTVNNSASEWAKGYVQAAIDKGLVSKDLNFQANASRELLVNTVYTIDQLKNISVASYKIVDPSNVEFTLNTGEVVKVKLEKALEANKETEVTFKNAAGQEITTKITWVVTDATKVEAVTADNLKEVVVKFDGEVDKATATDKANYSINDGALAIKSVTLLDDKKSARILLDSGYKFTNQTEYKISVRNVKAGSRTISVTDYKFSPLDNTLPTVVEAKALGTKAVKVTFSEPLKSVTSSNFQWDGAAFYGSVTKGADEREVILKPYGNDFSVGAHKLVASLVEDYNGLKSLSASYDVNVAEDTTGPAVTEVKATLEKATITFSEDIDPSSVNNNTFYWLSGTSKQYGVAKQISGTVYEVDFSKNPLPGYETTLYIDSVKDYSGNVNPVKEVKVTANVDLVRPQVSDVKFEGANLVSVKFDKAVIPGSTSNYTIKNSDGKVVPVRTATTAPGSDNKVVNLEFYSNLAAGDYTIAIAGVTDTTALKNVVQNYSSSFTVVDKVQPAASSLDANNATRTIAINFSKEMNRASLENKANYFLGYSSTGAAGSATPIALPSDVTVRAANNGKSVLLVFPEYINGKVVSFPTVKGGNGTVQSVSVSAGLQSASGAVLESFAKTLDVVQQSAEVTGAKQTNSTTLEVTFSQAIASASAYDFRVNGQDVVSSVTLDGDTATLKLTKSVSASYISVNANGSITTLVGNAVKATANYPVADSAAASVTIAKGSNLKLASTYDLTANAYSVAIPFNKPLATTNATEYGQDLEVIQASKVGSPVIKNGVGYTTRVVNQDGVGYLIIDFTNDSAYNEDYTVEIKSNDLIKTANGVAVNVAGPFTAQVRSGATTPDSDAAKMTSAVVVPGTAAVKASDANAQIKIEAVEAGRAGNGINVALVKATDEGTTDIKVKVTKADDATAIVVTLPVVSGEITPNVGDVVAAINADAEAKALVKATRVAAGADNVSESTFTTANGAEATKTVVTVNFDKQIDKVGSFKFVNEFNNPKEYEVESAVLNAAKNKFTVTLKSGDIKAGDVFVPVNFVDADGNTVTGSKTLAAS